MIASDILRVCELGRSGSRWRQALLLLAPELPHLTMRQLAALSLGRRNAYLLRMREGMLGVNLDAMTECPRCGTTLEFSFDLRSICRQDPHVSVERDYILETNGYEIRYRPLNSHDLALLGGSTSLSDARALLIRQSVVSAGYESLSIHADSLPDTVLTDLADSLSECDPQMDTQILMNCPDCSLEWSVALDVVSFFWRELEVLAHRFLGEVNILARVYGWSESAILSLSSNRRQTYLAMARDAANG